MYNIVLFSAQINKNNMKQTAVEWLFDNLNITGGSDDMKAFNQAKAMEKEMYFQFFKAGQESMEEGGKGFDQYYNETYESKIK